jgi:hypothetical protein
MSSNSESNLPGMGGVYNSSNLGLYGYGHNNPLKNVDPDGKKVFNVFGLYIYLGKGAIFGVERESSILSRHPHLDRLSPAMKENATKLMYEMEGRELKDAKGKNMLPFIVEEPGRTIGQQLGKVLTGKSKPGSLLSPKHLLDTQGNANAMDIGIGGLGQPDKLNKSSAEFYGNLNEAAGDLGLGVGYGKMEGFPVPKDPGHIFNKGDVKYNPEDLKAGREMYRDIMENRDKYPKVDY